MVALRPDGRGLRRLGRGALPAPVRAALMAPETRPRATEDFVVTARFRRIFAVDEIRAEVTSGAAPQREALSRLAGLATPILS